MNKEHEQGIRAFEHCLQTCINLGHAISEMHFESIGITEEDIENLKAGKKYLTEEQFYGFTDIMRSPMQIDTPLINWLMCADRWGLVGIVEPMFSPKKNQTEKIVKHIKAILDFPHVIINNSELDIREGDSLLHVCPHGGIEELFISEIDYAPYSRGRKPIYTLTVIRSKQNMQNTNNFNIGGNLQMSGNAHLNTGNVTDNSSSTLYELPPNFFNQARELLELVNEAQRQELLNVLEKIEVASTKNKQGQLFGKLFSLSFVADCVTVLQPVLNGLFKYLMS